MQKKFGELKLSDRKLFEGIRLRARRETCSHAFSPLYIWRKEMNLSVYYGNQFFVLRTQNYTKVTYLMPCGKKNEVENFIAEQPTGTRFSYLTDEDKEFLEVSFPGKFAFTEDRDLFEYIYDVSEQVAMEGEKFSEIRDHVKKIKAQRTITFEPLVADHSSRLLEIIYAWNAERRTPERRWYGDAEPSITAVYHIESLKLGGVLIQVDGKDYGFILGNELSPGIFDMITSKSNVRDLPLDLACRHQFFESIQGKYQYVNREDDGGISGLRSYNQSLQPSHMIRMWRAVRQ